jgi:hypothetical protein
MIQKFLPTFEALLSALNGDNMVLAGSAALISHGLTMSRQPEDLDVVIYQVTPEQTKVLKSLHLLAMPEPGQSEYPFEATEQFKFQRGGLIVNILLEKAATPDDLLCYPYQGRLFKVQGIAYNMQAKMSFRSKAGQHRMKNVMDALDLKNSNFNITG